jgi:hypothetical protein
VVAHNLVVHVDRVQVLDAIQDVQGHVLKLVDRIDFSSWRDIHIIFHWVLMLEIVLEYALMGQHLHQSDIKVVD